MGSDHFRSISKSAIYGRVEYKSLFEYSNPWNSQTCSKALLLLGLLLASMPPWRVSSAEALHPSIASSTASSSDLRVSFSIPGRLITNSVSLTLSVGRDKAGIRYTTDGSVPTERSALYSVPIVITNSVAIAAKAFAGAEQGLVIGNTYTFVDEAMMTRFSSNLPLVLVQTFGREIEREPKTPASVWIIEGGKQRATLSGTVNYSGRALLNTRGHSSLRYPKRSYHLKIRSAGNESVNVSLLGMPKESDWVLYAPYSDKTLMRDVLAYEISNQIGEYAPRTRFVEVFISESNGRLNQRHYMGVYVLEEKIKRDSARVKIVKLKPSDATAPDISGGYIFKKDHTDRMDMGAPNLTGRPNFMGGGSSMLRPGYPTGPGGFPGDPRGFRPSEGGAEGGIFDFLSGRGGRPDGAGGNGFSNRNRLPDAGSGFVTASGAQFLFVEPKPDEISPAQRQWLAGHIRKLEAVLYGPDFVDPVKGYAAYIDADSFIDHHLLVEATKNIDGFRFSTYYHKDRGGKIKMGPIWDWNLSLGNATGKQGFMAEHWYWPQLDDQQYSWFRRLFQDPDFAQKYVDRWGEVRTNQFALGRISARVDELALLLDEAQARNHQKWPILGRQVWPNHFVGRTYNDEVQYMKSWFEQRLTWIDHQFVVGPGVSLSKGQITLQATGGKVFFTLDGTDPWAAGGGVSVKAQRYKGPIPMSENVNLMARVQDGSRWSWPVRQEAQAK